jgi:protein arginine kinase activator
LFFRGVRTVGRSGTVLCELCKQNEATVQLKQIYNGQARDLAICETCAREHGFDVQSPLAMTDFLFGLGQKQAAEAEQKEEETVCQACHMRTSDFRKTSRLGCPQCYDSFSEAVEPMLADMHRGGEHRGKIPVCAAAGLEVAGLRDALRDAVSEQRFEEAALIRDRIHELSDGAERRAPAGEQEVDHGH